MGRSILAVVVGVILATVAIFGVEMVCTLIDPLPPGFDPNDPAAMGDLLARMPATALLLVALAYFLGAAAGAGFAARVARRAPAAHAAVVGGLLLALGVVNLLTIPHPVWFWPVSLAAFPLGTSVGLRIGRRQ